MGQQQLILLVLATVIVGIAIVIGIRAFTENGIRANHDAIVQDMVRIASDAQAWKQKPAPFGGQAEGAAKDDAADYTGLTLTGMGYPADALDLTGIYSNLNGNFRLTAAGATGATIQGCNESKHNLATIMVDGITDADVNNIQTAGNIEIGTYAVAACSGW
jgi:hypothetical protein